MDDDENLLVGVVLGGTLLFLMLVTVFILVTFCRSNSTVGVIFVCPHVDVHVPSLDDTMSTHRTSSGNKCPLLGSIRRLLSKNNTMSTETTDVISITTTDAKSKNLPSSENLLQAADPPSRMSTSTPEMWSVAPRSPGHGVELSGAMKFSDFFEESITLATPSMKAGYRLAEHFKDLDAIPTSMNSLTLQHASKVTKQVHEITNMGKAVGSSSNFLLDDSLSDDNKDVTSDEKITDGAECFKVPVRDYRDLEIHVTDETRGAGLLPSSIKSSCPVNPSMCLHTTSTLFAQGDSRYPLGYAFQRSTSNSQEHHNGNIIPIKTSRLDKALSEIHASLKCYSLKNHPPDEIKTLRWTSGHLHAHGLGADYKVENATKIAMTSASSHPGRESLTYPKKISSQNHKGFGIGGQKSLVKIENIFKYSCHLSKKSHEDASLEERVYLDRNEGSGHLCKNLLGGTDSRRIQARSDIRLIRPGPFTFNATKVATLYKNRKIKPSKPGMKVKITEEVGPSVNQNYLECNSFSAVDLAGKCPDVNVIDSVSEKIEPVSNANKRSHHIGLDVADNKVPAIESHTAYDVTDNIRLCHGPLQAFQEETIDTNYLNSSEYNKSFVSLITAPGKKYSCSSLMSHNKSLQSNDLEIGDTKKSNQKMRRGQNGFPYSFPTLRGCKRSVPNTCLLMASLRFDDGFLQPHDKDEQDTSTV